jgi:TATA-box binding protein (TBP) (component of TFIID and TFIIIB)
MMSDKFISELHRVEEFNGMKAIADAVQIVVTGTIFKETPKDPRSLRLKELLALLFKNVEVKPRNNAVTFKLVEPNNLTLTIFSTGKFIANNVANIGDLVYVYKVIYEAVAEASSDEYVSTAINHVTKNRRLLLNTLARNVYPLLVRPNELIKYISIKNMVVNVAIEPHPDPAFVKPVVDKIRSNKQYGFTLKYRERFPAYIIQGKVGNKKINVLLFNNANMVIANVPSINDALKIAKQIMTLAWQQ